MSVQTDVKSLRVSATGTALGFRTRIKAVFISSAATAGSLILRDGGGSGQIELQIDTPASAIDPLYILLPGEGILFGTDVHATLTNVTSATLIYG